MKCINFSEAAKPRCNLVLGHGAGADMDSPMLTYVADALAKRNINVIRFNFDYMRLINETGKRRPPPRMIQLENEYLEILEKLEDKSIPTIIGGKSMGGRVATNILERSSAMAAIVLGYPFHPNGKSNQIRIEHLAEGKISKSLYIIQGTRDPFGKLAEVSSYPLAKSVTIEWLEDGDHDFKPRQSSEVDVEENWLLAVEHIDTYIHGLLAEQPLAVAK